MTFRTNNGTLNLPDNWYDQSIYAFSNVPPGKAGVSVVLCKEKLANHKDLQSYKRMILAKLPDELPEMNVLSQDQFYNSRRTEIALFEYVWKSNYGLMHHYQAIMIHKTAAGLFSGDDTWGYCFTLSVLESLYYPELIDLFKQIVLSFKIER
jgi:hypothetical protein